MKRISILLAILPLMTVNALSQVECKIENLAVEVLPCNAQQKFAVVINFTPVNPAADKFKVQGNGINHGTFSYADLPITIDGLPGNCTTPYEFVIRDLEKPECSAVYNLGKICCTTSNCEVQVINLIQKECLENEIYKINFDVLPPTPGSLGFDVFLNGNFHSFHKYADTPVENLVIPNHGQDFDTLVVCNNDNTLCCDTLILSNKCSCFIENARSQVIECNANEGKYFLRLNFDHGTQSDSFLIGGASVLYGTFAYKNLPVFIGPLSFSNAPLDLLIADKNDVFCFGGLTQGPVQECNGCNIRDAAYEVLPCNAQGKIYIKFKFKTTNPGVKGFVVRGNGVIYGQYKYGEDYYYLGPITPDCSKNYEFVIVDNTNNSCSVNLANNVKLCCGACEIGALTIDEKCDQNSPAISLQFDKAGVPDDSVAVYVNGTLVGKFKKGADPLMINYPFVEDVSYAVKVIAFKTEGCFRLAEFTYNCNTSEPCAFKEPQIELSECNGDNLFKIFIKFIASGPHSDHFNVTVNDQNFGPFTYGMTSYTIGPIHMACHGIRIVLRDAVNESCKLVIEKDVNKCCEEECELSPGQPEAICFEEKIIGVKMSVNGKADQHYKVLMDGAELGTFAYSPIPVLFNVPPRAPGKITLKFVDVNDPTCFVVKEYYLNCQNCAVKEVTAKPVDCTASSFKWEINFDVVNSYSDSFNIFINNIKIGRYHVNQLPIVSPSYNKGNNQAYTFKIFDAANEACRTVIELPSPNCEQTATNDVFLKDIEVKTANGALSVILKTDLPDCFASVYALDGKTILQPKKLILGENNLYQTTNPVLVALTLSTETGPTTKLIFIGN
jgi:hypothetical protein